MNNAEFLPFHAINEFMRPDFRLSLIRDTLNALPRLSEEHNNKINNLSRKLVKVPGFRNSEKAPALMRVIPTAKAFEKSAELAAAILAAWCDSNDVLRDQVYDLLKSRGWACLEQNQTVDFETLSADFLISWPILPIHIDRTILPGFYIRWPEGDDYELLYSLFTHLYPDAQISIDQVSLMVVWLSLRLPYQMEEKNPEIN
jgi:hypothetical protein